MNIVIVGGGLSGLTLAERLSKKHKIILIEKEDHLGGLARSINYKNAVFDIGPHLFTAHDKKVLDYFLYFFRDKNDIVKDFKRTRIYVKGRFISWPPSLTDLIHVDPLGVLIAGLKAAKGMLIKQEYSSLEDYFIKNYGKRLYRAIFKPLFANYFKTGLDKIDASFAEAALTVAAKQEKVGIKDMIWTVLRGKKVVFYYPKMGIGELIKNIARKLEASGNVEILRGYEILSIAQNSIKIRSKKKAGVKDISFDKLIWTAPFTSLCGMMGIRYSGLDFMGLVIYNVEYITKINNQYQYSYVAEAGRPFHRYMLLHNISDKLSKNMLVTFERSTKSRESNKIGKEEKEQLMEELLHFNIISSPEEVISVHKEFIPYVYPSYYNGFGKDLEDARRNVMEKNRNIMLKGRSGNYSYLNMDHVLKEAIEFDLDKEIMASNIP